MVPIHTNPKVSLITDVVKLCERLLLLIFNCLKLSSGSFADRNDEKTEKKSNSDVRIRFIRSSFLQI